MECLAKLDACKVAVTLNLKTGFIDFTITLNNGDVVEEHSTPEDPYTENDLSDLWLAFSYNDSWYDLNVVDNRYYGSLDGQESGYSACVYPVDTGLLTDTSRWVHAESVEVNVK